MNINLERKKERKQKILIVLGLFVLIGMIGGFTFAFFNYTRTGQANTIRTGQINFLTTQSNTLQLTNVFPMSSTQAGNANLDAVSIRIQGDTTYADGEEFEISIVEVNDTIGSGVNEKRIPLNYIASYTATPVEQGEDPNVIGTNSNSYFSSRESTNTVYKLSNTGEAVNGEQVLIGYIPTGATGIDGTLTIKAYIDSSKIAISDTTPEEQEDTNNDGYIDGTTSTWVAGRTVLTTTEWNALQNTQTPLSFKIKAVSNEGTWVEQQSMPTSCFTYTEEDNEITITGYDNTCGLDVMIPDTINGKNVTKIGGLYNKGITSIVLPQYLSVINDGAFFGNQLSGQFVIPNSITSIGGNSFANNQITNLTIPNNVTSISSAGPFGNNPITTLNIDVSIIPRACFSSLSIQNLTLGEHVSTIGDGAFSDNQITNLTIPNNITSIESSFGSNPITTLFIDMETIPSNAFNPYNLGGQGQISSLTIGTNVKTINSNAFSNNRITNVTIPSNVETLKCNAFDNQKDSNNNSITTSITYEQPGFACTN